MAISIKEIINAIHCLASIDEKLDEVERQLKDVHNKREEALEWIREAIDKIDDRITRLEIIEDNIRIFNKQPNP